jgi:hypothetical protein
MNESWKREGILMKKLNQLRSNIQVGPIIRG